MEHSPGPSFDSTLGPVPEGIQGLRALVQDLRTPRAATYYLDIGASALAGWCGFALAVAPLSPVLRGAGFVLAAFALYRALAFIHELFHQQAMGGLRWLWHALVGVPLLLPLLLYLPVHQSHHSSRSYGTVADGEYEQFHGRLWVMVLRTLAVNFALPPALLLRFAVLAPLSAMVPFVRHTVIPGFVHLALRMPYSAAPLPARWRREAAWTEAACALVAWAYIAAFWAGYRTPVFVWAGLVVAIGLLNGARALCSTHLYVQGEQGRDLSAQLDDSLNIQDRRLLTTLMCPAGLQYHALHHAAPFLPYHALPAAHARLMQALPGDSAYHRSTVASLAQGWRRLVSATRR
jgi:fatty acid desaturase